MESSNVNLCCRLTSLKYRSCFRLSLRVIKMSSDVVTWVIKTSSGVVTSVVNRTSYVVTWVVSMSSPHFHLRLSVILVVTLFITIVSRQPYTGLDIKIEVTQDQCCHEGLSRGCQLPSVWSSKGLHVPSLGLSLGLEVSSLGSSHCY